MNDITAGFDSSTLLNGKIPGVHSAHGARDIKQIDAVSREFESLFLNELFKVMRKTVPEGSGKGMAEKMFTGMMDAEVARRSSGTEGLGIARMIRAQLLDRMGVSRGPTSPVQDGNWVRPVGGDPDQLQPGQRFGARRAGDRPEDCGDGHCGVDLAKRVGTPVRATSEGVVTRVGRDRSSEAGLWVELAHRDGTVRSRYLHLDSIRDDLKKGDRVFTGERIGEVGNTGTSSRGAHLHFEVFEKSPGKPRKYLDPQQLFQVWDASRNFDDLKVNRFNSLSSKDPMSLVDGLKERSAERRGRVPSGLETALLERYKLEKSSGGSK